MLKALNPSQKLEFELIGLDTLDKIARDFDLDIPRKPLVDSLFDLMTIFSDLWVLRCRLSLLRPQLLSKGHGMPLSTAGDFGDVFDQLEDALDIIDDARAVAHETLAEDLPNEDEAVFRKLCDEYEH